ncbi:MAG: hypothetical protein MUO70_05925 [Euryarchaeota archaeon]|nr:hypothetical protein [Euryarchaeota archaeon]
MTRVCGRRPETASIIRVLVVCDGRSESNTSKEVCGHVGATVLRGGVVFDGEFDRPFQWKRSAPSSGGLGQGSEQLGVARSSCEECRVTLFRRGRETRGA